MSIDNKDQINLKSKHLMDRVAAKFINLYCSELENTENEVDYCSIYTAALVFLNLVKFDFLSRLKDGFDYSSGESPEGFCKKLEVLADVVSDEIREEKNKYKFN